MTRSSKKIARTVKLAKSIKRSAFAAGGSPPMFNLDFGQYAAPMMNLPKGAAFSPVHILSKPSSDIKFTNTIGSELAKINQPTALPKVSTGLADDPKNPFGGFNPPAPKPPVAQANDPKNPFSGYNLPISNPVDDTGYLGKTTPEVTPPTTVSPGPMPEQKPSQTGVGFDPSVAPTTTPVVDTAPQTGVTFDPPKPLDPIKVTPFVTPETATTLTQPTTTPDPIGHLPVVNPTSTVPLANPDLYKGAPLNPTPVTPVTPEKKEDAAPKAPEQYSPEGGGGGGAESESESGDNQGSQSGEAGSDSGGDSGDGGDGGGDGGDGGGDGGGGGDWRGGAITTRRYRASGGPINLTRKYAKPAKHFVKKPAPSNALINKALGVVSKKT
jgi:hypothetical protein